MVNAMMLDINYVWNVLVANLPKSRSGGFIKICCPMCPTMGETPDTRFRCGITRNTDGGFGINCFNCGFKAKYVMGNGLSKNVKDFMYAINIPDRVMMEVGYMVLLAQRHYNKADGIVAEIGSVATEFASLPKNSLPIKEWKAEGCDDPNFLAVCKYLEGRGDYIANSYNYHWSPETSAKINRRVIIPFYDYGDRVAGWTGRLIDPSKTDRYLTKGSKAHLFNNHLLYDKEIETLIVNEGPFDAIATNGVALHGSSINDFIVSILNDCGKRIVIVPDGDKAGSKLIPVALENGWSVAFPKLQGIYKKDNWWEDDVDDPAKACAKYGHLFTVRSIIETATDSSFTIHMKSKFLVEKEEPKPTKKVSEVR
jgi:hypothetical protein